MRPGSSVCIHVRPGPPQHPSFACPRRARLEPAGARGWPAALGSRGHVGPGHSARRRLGAALLVPRALRAACRRDRVHAPLPSAQRPLAVGAEEAATGLPPAESQLHDQLRVAAVDLQHLQHVRAPAALCGGGRSGAGRSPSSAVLQTARGGAKPVVKPRVPSPDLGCSYPRVPSWEAKLGYKQQ